MALNDQDQHENVIEITAGLSTSPLQVKYARKWNDRKSSWLCYGEQIAVRVCNGNYWQANLDNNSTICATVKHVKLWETFEIVSCDDEFTSKENVPVLYNARIAFKSVANSNFIGANIHGESELTARVPWVKEWEVFELLPYPKKRNSPGGKIRFGNWFALRACNEKYVSYSLSGSKRLIARADKIDEWEGFVFIDPKNPK